MPALGSPVHWCCVCYTVHAEHMDYSPGRICPLSEAHCSCRFVRGALQLPLSASANVTIPHKGSHLVSPHTLRVADQSRSACPVAGAMAAARMVMTATSNKDIVILCVL